MWEIFGWCWTHEMYDNDFLPLPTPYEWTFAILTIKWSNKNINGGVYKFWIFQGYAFVIWNHFTFLNFSFVVVLKNQLKLERPLFVSVWPKGLEWQPDSLSYEKDNKNKTVSNFMKCENLVKRTKNCEFFREKVS